MTDRENAPTALRAVALVVAAAALAMGQRCPSEPSAPACPPPTCEITQADVDRAYDRGFDYGRQAAPDPDPCPTCPTCPEPDPCPTCPTCDVTVNDDDVADRAADRAVGAFVARVLRECSFGPSVVEAASIDHEVKRRISNLHHYGYCR